MALSETQVLVTGLAYIQNSVRLYQGDSKRSNLYSTTLKLGIVSTINDRWSTSFVLLPKIASDYQDISYDDFYLGGWALVKHHKNENFNYRFGIYSSPEAFGIFTTPIFGCYFLSLNKKFEMDLLLPISTNINYSIGTITTGFDYIGAGRSFNIIRTNSNEYVHLNSLELSSFIQFNALKESVLTRLKFGYAYNNFRVYAQGDKIDFGIPIVSFGDNRSELTPAINGGLFLKLEVLYRFKF